MPTNVTEFASKGDAITIPVGTDKRKASSLFAAWQAIGNRLKFWEDWHTSFLTNLVFPDPGVPDGGSISWKLASSIDVFKIWSDGLDGLPDLDLTSGIFVRFDQNVRGPLVSGQTTGRMPWRRLNKNDAGDINPVYYDTFVFNGSNNVDYNIATPGPNLPVDGDHFKVINKTSVYNVTIRDPSNTPIAQAGPTSGGKAGWVEVYYDGAAWTVGRKGP